MWFLHHCTDGLLFSLIALHLQLPALQPALHAPLVTSAQVRMIPKLHAAPNYDAYHNKKQPWTHMSFHPNRHVGIITNTRQVSAKVF